MRHYLTAEISRRAVANNLDVLRSRLPRGCKLCAVVKANCYGHTIDALLETIVARADALAVATIPEALEIRSRGYSGMILALLACGPQGGGDQLEAVAEAVRHDIHVSLTDLADIPPLERLAETLNKSPHVHVKIDTGMGRSGVLAAEAVELIQAIRRSGKLHLAGVFTHFAASDEQDKTHAESQFAVYSAVIRAVGPLPGVIRHVANSAAVADMPQTTLDMVRPGIAIYGYQPSEDICNQLPLQPALRLTAPIVQLKCLPAGVTCGYGRTHTLTRASRVGIAPAGYADCMTRLLSNRCSVRVGPSLAPVIGRISMDQVILDLTDCPAAKVGDRVELISPDPAAPNSVANLAKLCDTIPYEVTCRLGNRVTYLAVDQFSENV